MPKTFTDINPNRDPYRDAPLGRKIFYLDGTEETLWGPWSLGDLLFRRYGYPLYLEKREQIVNVEKIYE